MTNDSTEPPPEDFEPESPFAEWDSRMRAKTRVAACLAALGLLVPLVIAARLHPHPSGSGTHQQLGLPPCTSVYLFGVRCPACGMTTSWSAVLHAQPVTALRANTTGSVACLIAIASVPWMGISGLRGRWFYIEFTEARFALLLFLMLMFALIEWGVRLLIGGT